MRNLFDMMVLPEVVEEKTKVGYMHRYCACKLCAAPFNLSLLVHSTISSCTNMLNIFSLKKSEIFCNLCVFFRTHKK